MKRKRPFPGNLQNGVREKRVSSTLHRGTGTLTRVCGVVLLTAFLLILLVTGCSRIKTHTDTVYKSKGVRIRLVQQTDKEGNPIPRGYEHPWEVDLETPEGYRMGQTVVTASGSHEITVRMTGLPSGASVRLVQDGSPVRSWTAGGGAFQASATVDTGSATFVRADAWTSGGAPVVFSNPIYFLRAVPPGASRRSACRPARGW